jgi:hypothetical protein
MSTLTPSHTKLRRLPSHLNGNNERTNKFTKNTAPSNSISANTKRVQEGWLQITNKSTLLLICWLLSTTSPRPLHRGGTALAMVHSGLPWPPVAYHHHIISPRGAYHRLQRPHRPKPQPPFHQIPHWLYRVHGLPAAAYFDLKRSELAFSGM